MWILELVSQQARLGSSVTFCFFLGLRKEVLFSQNGAIVVSEGQLKRLGDVGDWPSWTWELYSFCTWQSVVVVLIKLRDQDPRSRPFQTQGSSARFW